MAATRKILDMLLAFSKASVVIAAKRSNVGARTPGEVNTQSYWMWSLANLVCRRQGVIALEALTSSTDPVLASKRSLATRWIPLTVVAHHGPPLSLGLQLRFSTWVSKWRKVLVRPPSYTAQQTW
jgi:hypothetical protein